MEKIILLGDQRITIDKGALYIGRSSDCDIPLDDEKVSRKHAVIKRTGKNISFEDLNSSNGSYINNKLSTGIQKIKEGDVIQIGTFVLKIDLYIPTRRYPALENGAIENGIPCPNCSKTVAREAKFCVFCGEPVRRLIKKEKATCPECGKSSVSGARYCSFCGLDFAEETPKIDVAQETPVFVPIDSDEDIKEKSGHQNAIQNKKEQGEPVGLWRRTFSNLYDILLLVIVTAFLEIMTLQILAHFFASVRIKPALFSIQDYQVALGLSGNAVIFIAFTIVLLSLSAIYFVSSWVKSGATIGKKIFKIRVYNSNGSLDIAISTAIKRFLYCILSVVTIVGYTIIGFKKNKTGLHDGLSSTVVRYRQ